MSEKPPKKEEEKKLDKPLTKDLRLDEKRNKKELKKLKKKLEKKLAKVEGYPDRGLETWFRLSSKNLYTRRQIVDTKSSILITVNSIIISVILGSLYTELDNDPHLIFGIVPMIITNLVSIAFAIFATRPEMKRSAYSKDKVMDKTATLMTFDDFYQIPLEEYEWAVQELMEDRNFLYSTIKKDIYYLGLDLSHRYRYIRIAYNVFLWGLVLSLLFFGGCHVFT